MRVDAQPGYQWRRLNEKVQNTLNTKAKVFVYRGLYQALFETALSLHLKFSHKKKVVAQLGFGDHLKNSEVELAKLGVRFKDQFEEEMTKEERSTLTYIHDLDDALTGELYDHIETLKLLVSTKMYRIHIAHHLFHIKKTFIQNLSDFDIIIASLDPNYALVFTGEKIVLPTLTVGQLAWDEEKDLVNLEDLLNKEAKMQPEVVNNFESNLPEGVTPWFANNQKRLFDRAVVTLNNHDSSAFLDLWHEEEGGDKPRPGFPAKIEALSQCRWENEGWLEQSNAFGKTPEDLRGTLVIDASVINEEFTAKFNSTLEKLNTLSY